MQLYIKLITAFKKLITIKSLIENRQNFTIFGLKQLYKKNLKVLLIIDFFQQITKLGFM